MGSKNEILRQQSQETRVGRVAGVIFSFIGLILPAVIIDAVINTKQPGAGGAASFIPLLFFWLPLIGWLIGGATGRITLSLIYQLGYNLPSKLCGVIGGGVAGLIVGILPYVLILVSLLVIESN